MHVLLLYLCNPIKLKHIYKQILKDFSYKHQQTIDQERQLLIRLIDLTKELVLKSLKLVISELINLRLESDRSATDNAAGYIGAKTLQKT